MDLNHLFVISEQRGKGVGEALLAGALTLARELGCSYFTVGTSSKNVDAQRFYRKMGFEPMAAGSQRFKIELAAPLAIAKAGIAGNEDAELNALADVRRDQRVIKVRLGKL